MDCTTTMAGPKATRSMTARKQSKANTDLDATDVGAPKDLKESVVYSFTPHDPSLEADKKTYYCIYCKQKRNMVYITKFCTSNKVCKMCSHSQWVAEMEGQIRIVLHGGDKLEAINSQLHEQNQLLHEQQVIQLQAPQTLSPSTRVDHETMAASPEWVFGIHTWPSLPTK